MLPSNRIDYCVARQWEDYVVRRSLCAQGFHQKYFVKHCHKDSRMMSKDKIIGPTIDIGTLYYMEFNRLFIFCVIVFLGSLYLLCNYKRPKNFPPGPWHIPFYGTSPSISRYSPNAWMDLYDLSKKYGNVFSIAKGNRLIF